jgi:hypothetical protein
MPDFFGEYLSKAAARTPAEKVEVQVKQPTKDFTRAGTITSQKDRIEGLMDGLEIDRNVLNVLSYNYSTVINKDREPPDLETKKRALWDIWTFCDIINFHGGSTAFYDCHREMVSHKVTATNFRQLFLLPRGHLKAQPLNRKVLTPYGWKTVGELKVGDAVVCGETGLETRVTHLHPISKMKVFKITTSDQRVTLCNEEHLWNVIIPSNKPETQTLSLKQIKSNYLTPRYDKRTGKHYAEARYRIELVAAQFQHNDSLPIDPYTLGAWLGDGTTVESAITSNDPEVIDKCEGAWEYKGRYLYTNTYQGFKNKLRLVGVLGNKHIPDAYKFSSYEQRKALLAGLIDTDGTPSVKSGIPSITQKSPRLAADIVDLVRSLGGKATYSTVMVNDTPYYYINVRTPFNPFTLERKAKLWSNPKNYKFWTAISSIEEFPEEQLSRCITVDSPYGMYITDNYLPTHNSTILSVLWTLWRIYQNPNIRIFVGTEGLKLSKAFIREIEQYLVDDFNKEYVWNARPHIPGPLIPDMDSLGKSRRSIIRDVSSEFGEAITLSESKTTKKVWRAEAIQVVRTRTLKEPTVTAGSVGQTSTGFHFDEVIFDDVHTFDNCSSETKIEKVFSWIYDIESVLDLPYVDIELVEALSQCLGNNFKFARKWCVSGGRMSVIGTRYDDADYYGHILDNLESLNFSAYERSIYINGVDSSDGYLWPQMWNEEVEKQKKAQFITKHGATGLARYYSQYHNKIVNLEDAVLDWRKVNFIQPQFVRLDDDKFVSIFRPDGTLLAEFRPILVIDPTSTAGKKSDFCAMAVGGVVNHTMYIIDFWMKKERPEVWIEKMWELVEKWNLHSVTIELVGGFKVLEFTINRMWVQEPDKYRPISIKTYSPGQSEQGKLERIETLLSPVVHNSLLYLPLHCSRDEELRKQFQFFGRETSKDDGPDVLAILKEVYSQSKRPSKVKSNIIRVVNSRWGGIEYAS